jgi:hypothetical protein
MGFWAVVIYNGRLQSTLVIAMLKLKCMKAIELGSASKVFSQTSNYGTQ